MLDPVNQYVMKSERTLLKYRGTTCLNCSQPLDRSEMYCHNCGQLNSTKKLTFGDLFNEFFAGIFAYDSRIYRTMRALLFRPGKISKDYVEGKRQRYANPYRFYLSASIIFFILMELTSTYGTAPSPATAAENELPKTPLLDSTSANTINRVNYLSTSPLDKETTASIDSILQEQSSTNNDTETNLLLDTDQTLEELYIPEDEFEQMDFYSSTWERFKIFTKFYQEKEIKSPQEALQQLNYPQNSYNKWLYTKAVDLQFISSNPEIFVHYFVSKLPFIIFFYLPFFALFIWLLYAWRPFTYMEHLIFTFHTQTMWFILYGIALILDEVFNTGLFLGIATILFLLYLYKAMRKFYGQKRVKTVVKFLILNLIFLILAGIAAVLSLIASFAIF